MSHDAINGKMDELLEDRVVGEAKEGLIYETKNYEMFNFPKPSDAGNSALEILTYALSYSGTAGGTMSSGALKYILSFFKKRRLTTNERKMLSKSVELWRTSLRRHNAQPLKVFTYNINTGEEIEGSENQILFGEVDGEKLQ